MDLLELEIVVVQREVRDNISSTLLEVVVLSDKLQGIVNPRICGTMGGMMIDHDALKEYSARVALNSHICAAYHGAFPLSASLLLDLGSRFSLVMAPVRDHLH